MFDDTQLENLPISEKLRLVTSLWDQIACCGETVSVPDTVLDNAGERIKEMLVDPTASLMEDEMWSRANGLR